MNKHPIFLAGLCLLLCLGRGYAAEPEPEAARSLYAELLGNGGIYSLNADYRLAPFCSVRVGYVGWHAAGIFGERERLSAFPVLVNYLRGQGNHLFEAGLGVLYGHYKSTGLYGGTIDNYTFTTLTGSLSYRYQRPHGGPFFKAGLTPFYSLAAEEKSYPEIDGFFPWFGFALGYSF